LQVEDRVFVKRRERGRLGLRGKQPSASFSTASKDLSISSLR
jgi:hypothetical protein